MTRSILMQSLLLGLLFLAMASCSDTSDNSDDGLNDDTTDGDETEDGDTDLESDDDDDDDDDNRPDGDTPDEDGDVEDSEEEQEEESPDPTNEAQVFPINPVATPDLITVDLPAADDMNGHLISEADTLGLRRIQVLSCSDEGETNTINMGAGPQTQRICTLAPHANKVENGNFIYDDYTKAVNGVFDPTDRHAEVEAFYHAHRFYDFFTRPEVGVFDHIPVCHGDNQAPITLVVNFQTPTPEGSSALQPIHTGMFITREHLSVGMGPIYGLLNIPGDVIVLGQGSRADFAYDGETIYHEMGHLMNHSLCNLAHTVSLDQYGMNALENALEQGLAETMTFLVSGRSGLFDYIDTVANHGYFRDADNDLKYPRDYEGVEQGDAMILAGAMWDVFDYLESEGVSETQSVRWLLLAMQSIDAESGLLDFSDWAESFLQVLDTNNGAAYRDGVADLFEQRGLMIEERARPLQANDEGIFLYIGGAYDAMWNDVLTLEQGEQSRMVYTAFTQLVVDAPEQNQTCMLQAQPMEYPGNSMYPQSDDWNLSLLVRKESPITYEETTTWHATATFDEEITPTHELDGSLSFPVSREAGTPSYLHILNQGTSPLFLVDIQLVCP